MDIDIMWVTKVTQCDAGLHVSAFLGTSIHCSIYSTYSNGTCTHCHYVYLLFPVLVYLVMAHNITLDVCSYDNTIRHLLINSAHDFCIHIYIDPRIIPPLAAVTHHIWDSEVRPVYRVVRFRVS